MHPLQWLTRWWGYLSQDRVKLPFAIQVNSLHLRTSIANNYCTVTAPVPGNSCKECAHRWLLIEESCPHCRATVQWLVCWSLRGKANPRADPKLAANTVRMGAQAKTMITPVEYYWLKFVIATILWPLLITSDFLSLPVYYYSYPYSYSLNSNHVIIIIIDYWILRSNWVLILYRMHGAVTVQ